MLLKNKSLVIKLFACAMLPAIVLLVVLNLKNNPSFTTVDDQKHHWQSEQWTLINYFAEWCKPCLEELPELNELSHSTELRIFGISYDSLTDPQIKDLIDKYNIEFPILTTPSATKLPVALPSVLPTTYLIAPNGEIAGVIHGVVTKQLVMERIAKLQNEES
ncbi:TlpA family protein disulfide reductase [Marinomonas epiphytica]